ncbi:MAG: substrate-binding domain-containing protein [Anaerolineales bacterium]|nr:substrate-binding domain-containing protein [Anaerolineales bacterium]
MEKPSISLAFIVIGIFALVFSACSQVPTSEADQTPMEMPLVSSDGFPSIDGSTSTAPMGAKLICAMMEVPCSWLEFVDGNRYLMPDLSNYQGDFPGFGHQGTHSAYLNLIDGSTDLILVARSPSNEEIKLAEMSGVSLDFRPIALDAFVFMVNENNPIPGLTMDEIQGIYSGEITNWQQVGGPSAQINPYQRNDQSGSQQLMRSLVMKDLSMVDAPELVLLKMIAPFYAISEDAHGIGYSVFYYEENMAPNEYIKLIAVDGVQPTQESITNRTYPFTSEVFLVVRAGSPSNSLAIRLRDWLVTDDGQELVAQSGYAPYSD